MNSSPATRTSLHFFKNKLPAFFAALSVLGTPACSMGQDEKTNYSAVAHDVVAMLMEYHYSNKDFEDELSRKALQNFFDTLDYSRLYFTKPEIEAFRAKYATTLDDQIQLYKLDPAKEIFAAYSKHVSDRFVKIKALLEGGKLDLNTDATVEISRQKSDWVATPAELDELWRKEITREVLLEHINLVHAEKRKVEKDAAGKGKDKDAGKVQKKTPDTPEQKVLKRHQRYLDTLKQTDEEDITNYLLSAIATAYDPHSEYMSLPEKGVFDIEMRKELIGIGAVLSSKDGAAEIKSLVPGGPADKSGTIKMGDMIVGVAQGDAGEMEDIEGMKLQRIVEKIRGTAGTVVRLKVQPADDPTIVREIRIVREKVEMKDTLAKGELIEIVNPTNTALPPQKIGWINLDSFYADMETRGGRSATADVKRILQRLEKENIGGLVLDLRGDGGGSLEEAIKLTGLFVKKHTPVVQQRNNRDIRDARRTRENPVYTGPMIVMTDRASASASEIFAAALQDTGRALIVGDESTFGKGTVQTLLDVKEHMAPFTDKERAGSLKVTIAKFYRINGETTQRDGVRPDVILPSRYDAMDVGERFLKFPLPPDKIEKLSYERSDALPALTDDVKKGISARSGARIKSNQDIAFINDYISRTRELIKKNSLSLNEKTRLAEDAANEDRNRAYKEDRKKRVADANKNGDPYRVLPVTLENVDEARLKLDSETKKEEKKSLQAMLDDDDDTVADTDDTFPHGFDPAKLETIHIIQDMVQLAGKAPTPKDTVRRD
jgi:carboxyl-terminal processing protease